MPQCVAQHDNALGSIGRLNRPADRGGDANSREIRAVTASAAWSSVVEAEVTAAENDADAETLLKDFCAARNSRKSGSEIAPVSSRPSYGVTTRASVPGSRMPTL